MKSSSRHPLGAMPNLFLAAQPAHRRSATITFVLLLLVAMIDKADIQLLPSVYLEVCQSFDDVGPSALGAVTFYRGFVQAFVAIFAGPLGSRYDRIRLIGFGCVLWAVASGLIGASGSFAMLTFARALNGAGIGLVVPILFSLVADLVKEPARGRAYGLVNFASAVGAAAGGYIATELAGIPGGVAGIEGWRFAFYLIAAIAIVLALLLLAFAREPREASAVKSVAPLSMRVVAAEAAEVLRIKSFLIILLQGAFGTAPWYALAFLTMLFELGGLSHAAAALMRSVLDIAFAFGTLLGGFLNDYASRISPNHGRPAVAQVSVFSGIPIFLMILFAVPPASAGPLLFLAGLLMTWCQGVNNTIMAEVTRPHLRPTIFGLDRMLEGLLSPLGGYFSGVLAEAFGFSNEGDGCAGGAAASNSTESGSGAALDAAASNAHALASALAITMCVPWTICFLAYTALHFCYAADKRRHEAAIAIEAQRRRSTAAAAAGLGDDDDDGSTSGSKRSSGVGPSGRSIRGASMDEADEAPTLSLTSFDSAKERIERL